jgi:hypothetical protein
MWQAQFLYQIHKRTGYTRSHYNSNMATEFITTTSKLTIKNNRVVQQRVVQPERNYWFHSFVLILLFIALTFDDVLSDRPYRWPLLIVAVMWISPHLVTIYRYLFVVTWRTNIPLPLIKSFKLQDRNELEEEVVLTLRSGRKKIYVFRKAEEQAEKFAGALSQSTPQIASFAPQ